MAQWGAAVAMGRKEAHSARVGWWESCTVGGEEGSVQTVSHSKASKTRIMETSMALDGTSVATHKNLDPASF